MKDGQKDRQRATGREDDSKDRSRMSRDKDGDQKDRQRATGRDDDRKDRVTRDKDGDRKDRQRATGREDDRKDRMTRDKDGDRQDRQRATGREQDKDRRMGADGKSDRGDAQRTRLSEQQRTTVRERITSKGGERNRVTNVNFDVRVGASVPRSVTLHTLPPDVVEIVPAYRDYRYVYVNNDIVIVDPNSYEVVTVIGSGSRTAGTRRTLTLAPDDRVYVRQHIDRGSAIKLGIGGVSIGMEVPNTVELRPLPSVIVERVPDLRDHRYFVYEDEIAIVDPNDNEVVLVLDQ